MQNDLFGDLPAANQPEPTSVLALLDTALPMAHFLVGFARHELGRFKERHRNQIVYAVVEFLSPVAAVSTADIEWWITEGLAKATAAHVPNAVLVERMDAQQRRIARRAAINMVGPNESENRLRCRDLIDQLFPT